MATTLLFSCKGGITAPAPIPVASVEITLPSPTIIVGSSVQLSAVARDAGGNALAGRSIVWLSTDPAVASVSVAGMMTGIVVGGPVTITATSEGKSGTSSITVIPIPVASVVVTPASPAVIVGSTAQLSAAILDANGTQLANRAIAWSSSNSAVASVSASGLVTGIGVGGPVTITATSEGKSGTSAVTVVPVPVASVVVTPAAPSVVVAAAVQLSAATLDASGTQLANRAITWSSSNSAIASVSATGLVTGVAAGGPVTITATSEGKSGTSAVTVVPVPVASVVVTPATAAVSVGGTVQLSAVALDANGHQLANRGIAWSSSNSAIAGVSTTGLVTGVATGGPITVTATSEGKNGSAAVTVIGVPINPIITGIHDANAFVTRCPTNDPAYSTIRQDFEFLNDGQPENIAITCTEPYTNMPTEQLTDELISIQTLRLIYYMGQGTAGRLPWTNQNMYDWMKASVAGIDFRSQAGLSACCEVINGKKYILTSRKDALNRDHSRDWNALSGWATLLAHEARHATGHAHVNGCPSWPNPTDPLGCDPTYDLNDLGSYGIQYWLSAGWATGYINVGIGCASPSTAQAEAEQAARSANLYLRLFVNNAPPSVTAVAPYGGPCLP